MPITKTIRIEPDEYTDYVSSAFDYKFNGTSTFVVPPFEKPDDEFSIGLVIGSSGSGKTTILREFFGYSEPTIKWEPTKAIISHFETPEEATEKLFASGLASVPTLCRPFHILSTGEQYRATIARLLFDGAVIDEFTSTVNRETAKSLSVAMRKYITKKGLKNIVIASCHTDIVDFINPDWVFVCDTGLFQKTVSPIMGNTIATVSWYV